MQLKLTFSANKPIYIPKNHHAMIQGFLYHLLKSVPEYANFLHETGYGNVPHRFKLFVYSDFMEDYFVENNHLFFYNNISLEIRSPISDFCKVLMISILNSNQFELDHQPISLTECTLSYKNISSDKITIRMVSPLTLSTTVYENDTKKTRFICPGDKDFSSAFLHNTMSKYCAAYGDTSPQSIIITPLSVTKEDKYVTKFNNRIYINVWYGCYQLEASAELLSFLYDTGIGSRNSQGFGMFELI